MKTGRLLARAVIGGLFAGRKETGRQPACKRE
jgi:hypothetical protein